MDYNSFGDYEYDGKVLHLTTQADFSNRLIGYMDYHEAGMGEEYQFEMSALAKNDDGNEYKVYWIFWATKGSEKDLDEYDYDNIDRIERI
jgi:hypothetical protein